MSYQPTSAEEQTYIADFNAHDQAIWNYHKQTGKSLEDSYQAITGKPWMEGRSIKYVGGTKGNTGNGFDMTKDRTVKSVLGKYVAPIGAGVLTGLTLGGAAPTFGLFGGGGAAAAGGGAAAGGAGAAGGITGTVLPGAVTAAGAAGPSLTSLILPAGIAAGSNYFASRAAAGASKDAAQLEADYNQKALDAAKEERDYNRKFTEEQQTYGRGQFADYLGRLQPFQQTGSAAFTNLGAANTRALPGTVPTNGNGSMVRLAAPDGTVREVPAAQADHYLSLGARRA